MSSNSHLLFLAILLSLGSAAVVRAQEFPNRPVRMIAPFTAGGGADIYARVLARKLSESFQQQVVVDNRGGAGSVIGTEIAAKAAPNGYTILFVVSAHAINPAIRRVLPYDSIADFAPISLFTEFPFFLVTHPSFAPQSVPEILALVRAKPGQINYATQAVGSGPHFAGEMFKAYAKVNIVHISYKGGAEATTAVVSGAAPITFASRPQVMSLVKAGKLRVLAVTSAKRSPAWPDMPTVQEGGVPNYDFIQWHGLLAPANTPKPIVARLNRAILEAMQDQEVVKTMSADGTQLHGTTPEQFHDFLAREVAKYQELVRAMGGLQVD